MTDPKWNQTSVTLESKVGDHFYRIVSNVMGYRLYRYPIRDAHRDAPIWSHGVLTHVYCADEKFHPQCKHEVVKYLKSVDEVNEIINKSQPLTRAVL